jgi:glycosyltransferase involved in cell wall biosynthesis
VLDRAAGTAGTAAATELQHVINAYEVVREWGPDVVHDHTLVGPIYAPDFGVPVVTTNHGPFERPLTDLYRAISGCVPIIAISHNQASTAGDIAIAAVIHHGLDVETYPLGDGAGGYALFIGRMSPDKGAHTAARIAREAGVPLRIAAKMREPAERAYFDAEVAPYLTDEIEYIGEVGGSDKVALLTEATCLLNPIDWPEPFGMVMIESLATGTPVLAPPCGSVREIVDDGVTGFVRAAEELATAMAKAGDLDRRACRAAVAERFTAERMAAEHVLLYEKVVADRGRSVA